MSLGLISKNSYAGIHKAPVVIPAFRIEEISRYPLAYYRLFATDKFGNARQIPFQIDEINNDGDFVLSKGKNNNASTSNGLFDLYDELSFMGDDAGELVEPKKFSVQKAKYYL